MSEAPQGDEPQSDRPEGEQSFVMPRHGVIREDNWAEYEAQGFQPVPEPLGFAQFVYGVPNVYTGDEYDWDAERPLRHKPGVGVYTNPPGLAHAEAWVASWEEWHRQRMEREQRQGQ